MNGPRLSRRGFLGAGLAAALPAWVEGCTHSSARTPAGGATDAESLRALVQRMVDFGPRLTGSPAHNNFLDWLEQGFQSLGLNVIRDPYTFTRWQAKRWSLELLDESNATPVDVAYYYPYSGPTPEEGVTGDLVSIDLPAEEITITPADAAGAIDFLENFATNLAPALQAAIAAVPGGVQGSILILNGVIPPLLTGVFAPFLSYAKTGDTARMLAGDYKRAWIATFTLQILTVAQQAGAAGAILVLDASPDCARGQYLPFSSTINPCPALLVNREVGAMLREKAASRPQVRLTLTADLFENTRSDSLVAILPGASDENMIVNTHTDGQNAFEENGAVACLAIAQHYAAIPQAQRPRTLVFSLVTGHMGPALPQTQGFVDNFPDLIAKAACGFTIEHFGATEWLDDETGYHATGQPEFAGAFHSQTEVGTVAAQAYAASALTGIALLRPIGNTYFGVGAPLHQAGVPSIGYLAGPNYLVTISDSGEMEKLDAARMQLELEWVIDTLHRLEVIPAAALKLGMTPTPGLP